MVNRCPCCGSVIPEPESRIQLTVIQRSIYDFIAKHPTCHIDWVWSHLYGDRSDGGPNIDTVRTHICHLNVRLKTINQRIEPLSDYCHGTRYRLVELPAPASPPREMNKEGPANVPTNLP